jgi:hypothetical protein
VATTFKAPVIHSESVATTEGRCPAQFAVPHWHFCNSPLSVCSYNLFNTRILTVLDHRNHRRVPKHFNPQPLDPIPPTYLPVAASDMGRNDILSPREVEGLISDGHIIVIWEGKVLRLNGWLDKHPGGRLAVLHMVGRDASDEINV